MLWLFGFLVYIVRFVGASLKHPRPHVSFQAPFVGVLRGAVMGADGRVSTSKTVAVLWTYSVASALLSIVIAKWMGHGHAYGEQIKHGLQGEYALLIGGPIGAAILAKGIVSAEVDGGASLKQAPRNPPTWSPTIRARPTSATSSTSSSTPSPSCSSTASSGRGLSSGSPRSPTCCSG